jgi:hypothetical protein
MAMKVHMNLDSTGGEEPTNNPPTSARHPGRMMTCAGLYGDIQNLRIKSLGDNNYHLAPKHQPRRSSLGHGAFGRVSAIEHRDKRGTSHRNTETIPYQAPHGAARQVAVKVERAGRPERMSLPTKPRHPTNSLLGVKMCSDLYGDIEKRWIKSHRVNTSIPHNVQLVLLNNTSPCFSTEHVVNLWLRDAEHTRKLILGIFRFKCAYVFYFECR